MPLPKETRFRWKTTPKGKIRLAFKDNKVIEVKKKGSKSKLTPAGRRLMKSL